MQTLIELIKLNGHVFEHIYGQRCSDESVLNLESIIGRVCEAIGKPLNEREDTDHDVLVKIHMYWYAKLRVCVGLRSTHKMNR